MITPAQIKAGRALLGWKQIDLASASGVSLPSINNIERNIISSRAQTLQKIRHAMEAAGIEFIDDSGVRHKKEPFEILQYDGTDFIAKPTDDMLACLQGPDDEVVMCSLDESMYLKHSPDQILRYDNHQRKTKFKERALIQDGDIFFLSEPRIYRWIPKDLMGKVPYLVYKNRFVLIMWDLKRVVIVKNQSLADSFRAQFNYLWSIGKKVPANSKRKLDDPDFIARLEKITKR